MATKHKSRKNPLDAIILDIVGSMQPISSEKIWLEIGESLDPESIPSRSEIQSRLLHLLQNKILDTTFRNDSEQYIITSDIQP
jgi:hypothetical protein